MVFNGIWKEKREETYSGINSYIEIQYRFEIQYHKNVIAQFDLGNLGSAKKGDVIGTKLVTETKVITYRWDRNENYCDHSRFKKL